MDNFTEYWESENSKKKMKRQERGIIKEAFKNSNHNVNNLITLDTLTLNPFHLTSNELNDSGLNLKIGTGNLQSLKGKAITLQDYLLVKQMYLWQQKHG